MGQYYEAAVKSAKAKNWRRFNSWDVNCSAKMCDQAFMDNLYTAIIKSMIFKHPMCVVWSGDYADPEQGTEKNLQEVARRQKISEDETKRAITIHQRMHYLVNHSKKVYFNYALIEPDEYGFRLDPLPLLCAEGNGRGGGDYFGDNKEQTGIWARDLISIEENIPEGYGEFETPFKIFR